MDLEHAQEGLPYRMPGVDVTFITLGGAIASFAGDATDGAKAWWRANASRAKRPAGEDRIVMMVHRRTDETDVVTRRPVREVSMCVFEAGEARPLDASEARSAYRTDPDTGRLLPPETDIAFAPFRMPGDAGRPHEEDGT